MCASHAEPPTIWKILPQAGCIQEHPRRKPTPLELRQPGEQVPFDLKDASRVPADPAGKQEQVVEIATFGDAGTSIWLHRAGGGDFDAEALFEVVVPFVCRHGLPGMLTFENDPRLLGSPRGRDFPAALVRFLWCVAVIPNVIPPRRPALNASVERFHRSLAQECLLVHRPGTLWQVVAFTQAYLAHSNSERPNQARWLTQPSAAGGLSGQAFAAASVPETVDPDHWLLQVDKRAFARTIRAGGESFHHPSGRLREPKPGGPTSHLLGQRRPEVL